MNAESLTGTDRWTIDFPGCVQREFPDVFTEVWRATEDVLATLSGRDLSPLARHSPGLRGYEWTAYLSCCAARAARVAAALRGGGPRVLDVGAYFGNFSLACARLGYDVTALDGYAAYRPALDASVALLAMNGVAVVDFAETGYDLAGLQAGSFDAVLLLGVIEHLPHTPRPMLEALDRLLVPGGQLIIDTPNLGYLYKREALNNGMTIFQPLRDQYITEPPFEGHHREYISSEIVWMLEQLGHAEISVELCDFSVFALKELEGEALVKHKRMRADPELRELIFATSRKPREPRPSTPL